MARSDLGGQEFDWLVLSFCACLADGSSTACVAERQLQLNRNNLLSHSISGATCIKASIMRSVSYNRPSGGSGGKRHFTRLTTLNRVAGFPPHAPLHPPPLGKQLMQHLPPPKHTPDKDLAVATPAPPEACAAPVPLSSSTNLTQLAVQYGASTSQLQLDSGITAVSLADGSLSIVVKCQPGNWSRPFAAAASNWLNSRAADPFVGICAPGSYVSKIAVSTSRPARGHVEGIHVQCTTAYPSSQSFLTYKSAAQPFGECGRLGRFGLSVSVAHRAPASPQPPRPPPRFFSNPRSIPAHPSSQATRSPGFPKPPALPQSTSPRWTQQSTAWAARATPPAASRRRLTVPLGR